MDILHKTENKVNKPLPKAPEGFEWVIKKTDFYYDNDDLINNTVTIDITFELKPIDNGQQANKSNL